MPVSLKDVDHIALLARLGLTEDERASLRDDLESILGYIGKLQALDTTGIEATAHVIDLHTPPRDDVVRNPQDADAMLANAPDRDRSYLRVPKIIE
ncbi:MAG: Asp-tRNA(Asn)/Glu-tRNA(Gln) amidotransferase subunit GatC [Deltaproteobacteria bacterium]|nr:Asp-tRNA(Asn)/Glu-tRNA(Gln) amidotransferase subunit GatC [Deltaproteobacteria bacterium]